jgi:hypothetical protein
LKTQELTFLAMIKRLEEIDDKGDKLEKDGEIVATVLLLTVFEDFTAYDSMYYLSCQKLNILLVLDDWAVLSRSVSVRFTNSSQRRI